MKRIVLRSNGRLSSLGWLALGLAFGIPFITVGLEPGGKPLNLVIGMPVLMFFLALALWDLGQCAVLTLDTAAGSGFLVQGRYHRRKIDNFGLNEVCRMVLVTGWTATDPDTSEPFYELRLELRSGRFLTLPLATKPNPREAALQASSTLGLTLVQEYRTRFGTS